VEPALEKISLEAFKVLSDAVLAYFTTAFPPPLFRTTSDLSPAHFELGVNRGLLASFRVSIGLLPAAEDLGGDETYGVRLARSSKFLLLTNVPSASLIVLILLYKIAGLFAGHSAEKEQDTLFAILLALSAFLFPIWLWAFLMTKRELERWFPGRVQAQVKSDIDSALRRFFSVSGLNNPSETHSEARAELLANATELAANNAAANKYREPRRIRDVRISVAVAAAIVVGILLLAAQAYRTRRNDELRWQSYTKTDAQKFLKGRQYAFANRILERLAQRDAEAAYLFGVSIEERSGSDGAMEWYRMSAEKGYAPAQYELGFWLLQDRQTVLGREWLEKAAQQGNREAETQLGMVYSNWTGVRSNSRRALEFYSKAALAGDNAAQCLLSASLRNKGRYFEAYRAAKLRELSPSTSVAITGDRAMRCPGTYELQSRLKPAQLRRAEHQAEQLAEQIRASPISYILPRH
jgi:hypothetical protein